LVNTLAIFATVFGVATSLGLGAMQINSGLKYAFGIPSSDTVAVVIILVVTAIFITSAVSGIQRGILFLSHLNMIFAGALIALVFTLGPTTFLLKFFTESLGAYLGDLVPTSFWTDAFGESDGWLDSWTVFYWAWWISWSPFVGGFIARISKGRTIGEFVVGTLIFPTILSFVFITVLGGTALHFDLSGVTDIAAAVEENTSFALFALLDELPASLLFSLIAILLIAIFFITSADSSTYVCAIQTSRGVKKPPRALLVFWGVSECLIAIFLLMVGGLSTLQSAAIIAAFPFMIVCLFLILALLKALRREDCHRKERLTGKR
jgi:glycine betaine transporter